MMAAGAEAVAGVLAEQDGCTAKGHCTSLVGSGGNKSFLALLDRLSEASVRNRHEAYRDIAWDAAEYEIDPLDPRWEATAAWDPLAASEWYRSQPAEVRSRVGLVRQACVLRIGIEFERVLSEGLLRFAWTLPNGHPAFRYVYHEITEEAQHSMMFQEFINRTGVNPPGADGRAKAVFRRVAEFGETEPVLFFLAILSGEEAFDFVQRRMLDSTANHPLMARINRIHVIEEARHLAFGRALLRDVVPKLPEKALRVLRLQAPSVVEWTAARMFDLSEVTFANLEVPHDVRLSVAADPVARRIRYQSISRIAKLCDELKLVDSRLDRVWSQMRDPAGPK